VTDVWSSRAEGYRAAVEQRQGEDLDLIVAWSAGAKTALDVATGGGHVARRLREAGLNVITCDPAPGMHPDVICRAEDLPFAPGSFDVVVTRIAPHHFEDVPAAIAAMARASRDLVIVEDTLYASDRVEEAERLRDPTHIRSYSEAEWRSFLMDAGLVLEEVRHIEKTHPFDAWLTRTGCEGEEAERVRALLSERTTPDGSAWTDVKVLLRARKGA
jgi:SAM-dependent methyltransferase